MKSIFIKSVLIGCLLGTLPMWPWWYQLGGRIADCIGLLWFPGYIVSLAISGGGVHDASENVMIVASCVFYAVITLRCLAVIGKAQTGASPLITMMRPWLRYYASRVGFRFLLSVGALTISSCIPDMRSAHGIVAIPIEGGRQVYFKREVRGLSYDVLTLSANSDPCRPDDPVVDDVFNTHGPVAVYYKIEGGRLQVYASSGVVLAKAGDLRKLVEHHELVTSDYLEMRDTYKQQSLTDLDVPLNVPRGRCR
jgi:hypothetical protein